MSSRRADEPALARAWVDAWREEQADELRVRRAYLRFLERRTAKRRPSAARHVVRWVLVGFAVGVGSVYAASGAVRWLAPSEPSVTPRAVVTRGPEPTARVPRAEALLAAPPVGLAAHPVLLRDQLLPVPSAPAAAAGESWQRAARGLRERDYETAGRALDELARTGSSAERESAQLVKAQLLLSQGRANEAVTLLGALQSYAQSLSVREKSAELLARVTAAQASQRSFEPAAGTNGP